MQSNTPFSGQETGPHRNPYAQDEPHRQEVPPEDPGTVPPAADPKRTRFSAAAITGIVLATLGWAVALLPLITWIRSFFGGYGYYGMGGFFDLIGFLGVFALVVSVAGLIFGLRSGNRKLAARLYIIPSLMWQIPIGVPIVLILIALADYSAT